MKRIPYPTNWNRKFRRILAQQLQALLQHTDKIATQHKLERYRKHFHTRQHAGVLLFHGLTRSPSLRQSYQLIHSQRELLQACDLLDESQHMRVSFSQLAASNHSRDAVFMQALGTHLLHKLKPQSYQHKSIRRDIHLLDSTCIKVSPLLASWADGISNVRLQVQLRPAQDLPEQILLTNFRKNDCQGLDRLLLQNEDNLAALAGQTLVVDLGYYSHKRFQCLRQAGVHFVTRRHHQAAIQVVEDCPIQHSLPEVSVSRIDVLTDQRIVLGSPNNRAGAVLADMRMVTARVSSPGREPLCYEIITDRWDLTACEVIQYYLWRWEIELFFRWVKSHLCLEQLLGYSSNAVCLSIWLVIVVHLLTLLLSILMEAKHRSPVFLCQLLWCLAQLSADDFNSSSPQQLPLHLFDTS